MSCLRIGCCRVRCRHGNSLSVLHHRNQHFQLADWLLPCETLHWEDMNLLYSQINVVIVTRYNYMSICFLYISMYFSCDI